MRSTMTFLLALALLAPASVLVPTADAARSDVHVRAFHEGDLLRYEAAGGNGTEDRTVLLVEGASRAVDAFGIPRNTVAFLTQAQDANATVLSAERCHALASSVDTVRRDVLHGGRETSWGPFEQYDELLKSGSSTDHVEKELASFDSSQCAYRTALAGRALSPGDRITLGDLGMADAGTFSSEGVATRFHDRAAVRFDVPVTRTIEDTNGIFRMELTGTMSVTFADGIPGVVESHFVGELVMPWIGGRGPTSWGCELPPGLRCTSYTEPRDASERAADSPMPVELTVRLTGFVPGSGPALAPVDPTVRLPGAHPNARVTAPGPHAVDDEALAFPYAFRDAFERMRADPTLAMGDFLREHPDALITTAFYDRHMRVTHAEHVPTEGGWEIRVHDGGRSTCARSILLASTPAAATGRPLAAVNEECPGYRMMEDMASGIAPRGPPPATPPAHVVDSATLAKVLTVHGLAPEDVAVYRYDAVLAEDGGARAVFTVTNVSRANPHGLTITLDGATGSANRIAVTEEVHVTTGPAPLFPAEENALQKDRPRALAALTAPVPGAGLAVGGLAALVLLALVAAKVAWPLYTRIRADRVLEHPVRQKLFAHVRAHPGVHRAALVDVAQVGEGATRRHLDHLTREGFLREVPDAGFVRYFAAGALPPDAQAREAVLRGATTRRVHALLSAEPHLSLRDAGRRLDLSAPTVHRAVKRLRKAGLLPAPPGTR